MIPLVFAMFALGDIMPEYANEQCKEIHPGKVHTCLLKIHETLKVI